MNTVSEAESRTKLLQNKNKIKIFGILQISREIRKKDITRGIKMVKIDILLNKMRKNESNP